MPHELETDIDVATKLKLVKIPFKAHQSTIVEINKALKTASKKGTRRQGYPEYIAQSGNYILIIEDKRDTEKQAKYVDSSGESLLMDKTSIMNYAENGAVHYALHIVNHTSFKNVFAIGCSGAGERLIIRPIYVSPTQVKLLPRIKDFDCLSPRKIKRYYNEIVLGNKPVEQVELEDILHRAEKLHEDLRNYGQLGDAEKPLVVSGILLALRSEDFDTENLAGSDTAAYTDGVKIFNAISSYMDAVEVQPQVKKDRVLSQFRLIKDRPYLSKINTKLGKSPLRYFAEYLHSNILNAISSNTPEDVLGRFYGEFIRYSGGDGQTLGVVLTPKHIAELFADLVELTPSDNVFDPTCGTGSFLVAALHKMLLQAKSAKAKDKIKRNQMHGIELRDDMFSIATTNMILRGDGKSNLLCQDFFAFTQEQAREKEFTVGLMNPPYSQAKNKATSHLSELKFISHLLDCLQPGGRCAVIVPQSTMVGKSKEDKQDKQYIYDHHTLEGVITLNTNTFYGVGVNPAIAVFTAGHPHPSEKLVKFVDFKDDGYEVFPHLGLLPTTRVDARRKLLLDCWFQGKAAPNSFIVRCTVLPEDEWLHSFYYFNEEIPSEEDFEKTMADYLSFEFSMIVHGRGYLFGLTKKNVGMLEFEKRLLTTYNSYIFDKNILQKVEKGKPAWKSFVMNEIFNISSSIRLTKDDMVPGDRPFIGASDANNGITAFVGNTNSSLDSNVLGVNYNGSVVENFYHPYEAIFSDDVKRLHLKNHADNKYILLFIKAAILKQKSKYEYGYKFNGDRMARQHIMLPATKAGSPDFDYMECQMRAVEAKQFKQYISTRLAAIG